MSAAQSFAWPRTFEVLSPSIVEGELHFVIERAGAFIGAARATITNAGVSQPELSDATIEHAEACGWGTNLAARARRKVADVTGRRRLVRPIPAPLTDPAAPPLLECSRDGVRVGAHFHAWSSP